MFDNSNEASSKKKFIIPLLALLLCGISLMGTAYAYNSSLNTEGDLNVHSYVVTVDGSTAIKFKQPLAYDSYIDKEGKAKYMLNDFSDTITLTMRESWNTSDFIVKNVDIKCNAPGAYFDYSVDGKVITLKATALKGADGKPVLVDKPAASYTVTLNVLTEGVPGTPSN